MTERGDDRAVAGGVWRIPSRVRIPLGVVVLIGTGVRLRHLLSSGEVLPVLTWVMVVAFVAWLLLVVPAGGPPNLHDVEQMRSRSGRQILAWSLWLLVGTAWLVATTALYSWNPGGLVFVVVPLVMLILSLPGYLKAEQIVERARQTAAARSRRRT